MSHSSRLSSFDLWLLLALTLSWGVNWPVSKIGVADFPPLTFRTLSMLGGVPLLAVIAWRMGVSLHVRREHWAELAELVLTNMVLWLVLSIYGIQLLSSGRAAILAYTMPVWAAGIGIALFGEHPSRRLWVGVAAATVGVLLLVGSELSTMAGRPLGTLLMLASAAVWGYGTHRMRRRVLPTHIVAITFWALFSGLVLCAALALVFERESWSRAPNGPEWAAIVFNATVIFGLAQLIWFRLATILTPVASGLSVMLIPVIGVFSGMLLLGERPGWQDWIALAAILVAMATVLLPARGVARA